MSHAEHTTPGPAAQAGRSLHPAARRHLPGLRGAALGLVAIGIASLAACATPVNRTTHVYEAPGYEAPAAYVKYGTVQRIEVVETSQQAGGGGAVLGGVLGGLVGNTIGHGGGRAAATVLGAFGGAAAGNEIERYQAEASSRTVYHVVVRFDNGQRRSFNYRELNGLRPGDRVRFQDGVLGRG
jgi:outer membrane lipoprotein SlyB